MGRPTRPTTTDRNYRTLSIIPQAQQARMNQRVSQVLDTGGEGDETYVVGLSPNGSEPVTHYMADMILREADLDNFLDIAQFVPQSDIFIWVHRPEGDVSVLDRRFGPLTNVQIVQKGLTELLDERGLSRMNPRDSDGNIP